MKNELMKLCSSLNCPDEKRIEDVLNSNQYNLADVCDENHNIIYYISKNPLLSDEILMKIIRKIILEYPNIEFPNDHFRLLQLENKVLKDELYTYRPLYQN